MRPVSLEHSVQTLTLPRPTARIQPKEDQSSPRGHEADAQTLTSLPHTVQGKSEPHHDEAA